MRQVEDDHSNSVIILRENILIKLFKHSVTRWRASATHTRKLRTFLRWFGFFWRLPCKNAICKLVTTVAAQCDTGLKGGSRWDPAQVSFSPQDQSVTNYCYVRSVLSPLKKKKKITYQHFLKFVETLTWLLNSLVSGGKAYPHVNISLCTF